MNRHFNKYIISSLLLLFVISNIGAQESNRGNEYLLKSATLYRICQFVVWPNEKPENETFAIYILGKNPDGVNISIPSNKKIGSRQVEVINIENVNEIKNGEVLFVFESEESNLDSILNYVKNLPILTVSDSRDIAEKGIMFNFYIEDKTVKFEINRNIIRNSELKVYPQVYNLGKVIN